MENFKRSIDTIHAPKELLAKTMEKMHEENERLQQEGAAPIQVVKAVSEADSSIQAVEPVQEVQPEETGKIIYLRRHVRRIAALAACLVLLVGGAAWYRSTNKVTWNSLPAGSTIINNGGSSSGLPAIEKTAEQQLAELYKTEKTKKIEGHDVLFIRDEENDVYIAYWENGDAKSTYVSDPGAKEKDFLEEVKEMLKK